MRRAAPAWLLALAACGRGAAPTPQLAEPELVAQASGVSAVLQAVSAVSDEVAWVTGHAAVVLRTTNGGATWQRLTVPNAERDSLQFRDVEAFDQHRAYILAAGPGPRSRILYTSDGGRTWTLSSSPILTPMRFTTASLSGTAPPAWW